MRNGRLYSRAHSLAVFTILYNLVEGLVSMGFGASDETLSLFGFGVDSFIEVISAVGVWHMLRRIRANGEENRDEFERRALSITGTAFYLLAVGLVAGTAVALWEGHAPVTTVWGIVVSLVSLTVMGFLIHAKTKVGKSLNSQALLADAACSRVCLYLSVVLLVSSLGYALTGLEKLDALGALVIAWFSFREGREAFEKAKGNGCGCSCCSR